MKKLFIILATALCLAGCAREYESPVYGKRYRWDTDMPTILDIKTKCYYQVYEFSGTNVCEVYYTDINGGITQINDSFGYSVKNNTIELTKDGNYIGCFEIISPKCIMLKEMNGNEFDYEYFLY